jgi:hypothetical protein
MVRSPLPYHLKMPIDRVDVNVYGFLTIPEDAKIGVSAHEIGHLGKITFKTRWQNLLAERNQSLDGPIYMTPTIALLVLATGA